MIYLLLATICSCGMGVMIRYSEHHCKNMKAVTVFNYVLCIALSFAFLPDYKNLFQVEGGKFAIYLGVVNGLLYFSNLLIYQLNQLVLDKIPPRLIKSDDELRPPRLI